MDDHDRIRRAEQGRQILDNPRWQEAFASLRQGYLDAMERAETEDVEAVLCAKRMLAALHQLAHEFEMMLKDGAVSREIVKEQEQRKKWFSINLR